MIKLVNIMSLVFFFRLPVVVVLLWELKDFRVIVETGMRFFSPFMSVLFSLYLILFAYSEIGVLLYCELITLYDFSDVDNNGNPLYALLNFNDLASGMLTNFAILVSNNWNSFTDMYSAFVGNNIGPRFYFGFFFMLSIMVFLNIVVSFIMEIYEVTLEKLDKNSDKMENVSKVMEAAPTTDELKTLIRKAKLYDKMMLKRQYSFDNSSVSNSLLTFLN